MSTAVLFDRYGTVDELYVAELPVPSPGADEVVVRYQSIGVNPIDWKILRGDLADRLPLAMPSGPGVEAAGAVVAVGPGVTRFKNGDAVIRHGRPGTYRLHETVSTLPEADELTPMPARFTAEQAAVLPVAAGTAFSALRQVGLGTGQRLLVHGASGGVGLATVQLAFLLGAAEVIGTASAHHHDLLRSMGATPVEYGDGLEDRLAAFGPPDASVDCAGGPQPYATAVQLISDPTRRVTIVPESADLQVPLVDHVPKELPATLSLIGDRPFHLPVTGRYPLASAAEALTVSQKGSVGGKLVLLTGS
ncbi:NADP-dependent oxidoreductase [Streptomyces angustmyceticus]|uniref:NADP-dependent oxidoreductase n=1 Tax=Streptomyces angustmyceticus TaxID=285578 RepID=UPI003D8ECB0C